MGRLGKKILAVLLCAVLTGSLAACGSQNDASPAGTAQAVSESAAGKNENAAETKAEQAEGTAVVSKGRYMETTYPLPENNGWQSKTFALTGDGGLAYFDAQIGLFSSADEGKTWSAVRDIQKLLPEGAYVMGASITPDMGMALVYAIFGENRNNIHKVVFVDPEGTLTETEGAFEDGDYIMKVFCGPDGSVYGISVRGRICTIDMAEDKIKQLFTTEGIAEMLAFSGDSLLALTNEGVKIYDLKNGALMDSDPVLDEFVKENMGGLLGITSDAVGGWITAGEDGVLYAACSAGVYRHVRGGNTMEQLIDGELSSFGDPTLGMCALLLLDGGEFLLLTPGQELIRFTYDAEQPTVPEQMLSVFSLTENTRVRQAMSVFQKKNPDVFIKYQTGMKDNSAVTKEDALKNLNVELMSGNGPDVLLLDGMDESVYVDKGMLSDLSGILDGMTGENALYENIAGAYRSEKGTFVIPANFKLNMICGGSDVIEQVKDLKSLADVVEKLRKENAAGTITGCLTPRGLLAVLTESCGAGLLKNKELDTGALTELLTQAKRIYDIDMDGIGGEVPDWYKEAEYSGIRIQARLTAIEDAQLPFGMADSMLGEFGLIQYLEQEKGYSFALWEGKEGTGFLPANKLAIAANTKKPEMAAEFVKTFLSPEVQKAEMGDGFPVNIQAFDVLCKTDGGSIGSTYKLEDGTEKRLSFEYPKGEIIDRIKELVGKAETNLEGNPRVLEAVLEFGEPVLTGEKTVEEGVSEIQSAVSIYLAE